MIETLAISGMSIQLIIAVVFIAICFGVVTWLLVTRKDPVKANVERRMGGDFDGNMQTAATQTSELFDPDGTKSIFERFSLLSKPLEIKSDYLRSELALRLARAGYRNQGAVATYLSFKMIMMFLAAAGGLAYALSTKASGVNLLSWTTISAMIGFLVPNIWLRMVSNQRAERISNALPDSLDMLVIAVEAGLGFDSAIQRVGEEMYSTYPELAEEWQIAARETQMGIPRAEAMRKMADRTAVSDMCSLVAVLTQAERLGTSVANTLRVHAESMRVKRRQRAEERAAQTTVKLMFPLIMFLFPVMFIVIMGPVVVNWVQSNPFAN